MAEGLGDGVGAKVDAEEDATVVGTGESGGVGRLLTNVNGAGSSSKWKGSSRRGDWSERVRVRWRMLSVSDFVLPFTMGCSDMGRNSDEAVLDDLDKRGRWVRTNDDRGACDESLSRLGWSKDIGRVVRGDMGGGGLEGGIVIGLRGIWKYFVVLGRSTVVKGATALVWVGGWYVMPNALCRPVI